MNKTTLPSWMLEALPAAPSRTVLSFDGEGFLVSHDGSRFTSLIEAYDYAHTFKNSYDIVLDPSLAHSGAGEFLDNTGTFFSAKVDEKGNHRALMGMTAQWYVEGYEESYYEFLHEHTLAYEANPTDFLIAYKWLSCHPAFWIVSPKHSFMWEVDNCLSNLSMSVFGDETDGSPVVFLEFGIHTEDYLRHYHDTRIFATESTFEQAIITMAKKVAATYNLDGTEKEEPQ